MKRCRIGLFALGVSLLSSVAQVSYADTTSLRCFYQENSSHLTPATKYVWGVDPTTNHWYTIDGYWYQPGVASVENMFYSKTSQDTLQSICQSSLLAQGVSAPLAMFAAADAAISLNYTVWTLDTSAHGDKINRIVAFGDSLSDTQNMYNATDWKLPNSNNYFAGRFTNGKNWLDYLSDKFKLPVYNWAVGGAAADNYYIIPGVDSQVTSWIDETRMDPGYKAENTLFTILIGGNDLANYGRSVDSIIVAEYKALTDLIQIGHAKNILLVNLPDVSHAPIFAFKNNAEYVSGQVKYYNRKLGQIANYLRKTYSINIQIYDAYGLFQEAMQDPAKFGITNTTQSCLDLNSDNLINYLESFPPRSNCTDPDKFIFWDLLHPTTHTHKIMADKIGAFIQDKF